jgi:hypothetical protein
MSEAHSQWAESVSRSTKTMLKREECLVEVFRGTGDTNEQGWEAEPNATGAEEVKNDDLLLLSHLLVSRHHLTPRAVAQWTSDAMHYGGCVAFKVNPSVETSRCIRSEVVIIFFGGRRERGEGAGFRFPVKASDCRRIVSIRVTITN